MSLIKQVPTNVITGFLGVGKSTAIMHLMKSKPDSERWAVLVNEFGEVGIDGSIFQGHQGEQQGVFIREVPGGCMCCAAGLPMQIALNMLLAKAKPHRLLIEPTGLGHPKEVLSTLHGEYYKDVLDIQRTITLVDARKLADARYVGHEIFQQQLEQADVVVANKADLYVGDEYMHLKSYLMENFSQPPEEIYQVSNGEVALSWLQGKAQRLPPASHHHEPAGTIAKVLPGESGFAENGFISVKNQGEGFFSQGWVFKAELVFDRSKLYDLLVAENIERLKAVFITNEGIMAFNKVDEVLTLISLDEASDSRIELITRNETLLAAFEGKALSCLV